MDNKSLYASSEFELWNQREGLLEQERYFLSKYILSKEEKILEAGTGGGRISYELEKMGFSDITAYDYVEKMVESAKLKNPATRIRFLVADATELSVLPSMGYDRLIYLQQIISFIPKEKIQTAFNEAYRLLKPEGIIIFSFLNWNGRSINPFLSLILNTVRFLRNNPLCRQSLPWLRVGGKPNWNLFSPNQPQTYWFKRSEIVHLLESVGFNIVEIKTSSDFTFSSSEGMLYIVCQKKTNQ